MPPGRAIRLCLYAIFAPSRLIAEETAELEAQKNLGGQDSSPPRARTICRAFWRSLGLVVASALAGVLGAVLAGWLGLRLGASALSGVQVVGAMVLLWGTLFVRGYEIQTWVGDTLSERVNKWLYRSLYCLGTAVIVFSLVLPLCSL